MTADAGERGPARARMIGRVLVVLVGLAIDQVTKLVAVRSLSDRPPVSILSTLQFDLHYNSGFSFGTGQGSGPLIALLVVAISIYLIVLVRREPSTRRGVILAVILSGALGNLLDRIFRAEGGPLSGDVVDFIDVSWFAIFNVADIFVVGGIILFVVVEVLGAELLGADRSGTREGVEE